MQSSKIEVHCWVGAVDVPEEASRESMCFLVFGRNDDEALVFWAVIGPHYLFSLLNCKQRKEYTPVRFKQYSKRSVLHTRDAVFTEAHIGANAMREIQC